MNVVVQGNIAYEEQNPEIQHRLTETEAWQREEQVQSSCVGQVMLYVQQRYIKTSCNAFWNPKA